MAGVRSSRTGDRSAPTGRDHRRAGRSSRSRTRSPRSRTRSSRSRAHRSPRRGHPVRERRAVDLRPWLPLGVPLASLVLVGLALLPMLRSHSTPDGVAYLSIAEHLASGRFAASINAYWSPLWSWLAAPVLAVGIPPLVAAKLVGLLSAVWTLVALDGLLRTTGASPWARALTLTGTVPFLVQGATTWISPDLLVAAPILVLGDRLISGWWRHDQRAAFLTGLVGGVAYLAKVYALPVVAVAVLAAVLLAAREQPRQAALRGATLVAGVAVVVGAWGAVLSLDRGELTIGTSGSVNAELVAPGSLGSPLLHAGLFHPPHPASVTAWEDPSDLDPGTADGETGDGTGGATGEPEHAPAGDEAGQERFGGLLTNVPGNLGTTFAFTLGLWPVGLLVLLGAVVLARSPRLRPRAPRVLAAVALAAVWVGGLQPLIVHDRYLWPAPLLLAPLVALVLDAARRRQVAAVAAVALVAAWAPYSVAAFAEHRVHGRGAASLAEQLAAFGVEPGDRLATDRYWNLGTTTCFNLGCRFHGMVAGSPERVAAQLEDHEVGWVLWWRDDEPPVPSEVVGTAVLPTGPEARLHRLR